MIILSIIAAIWKSQGGLLITNVAGAEEAATPLLDDGEGGHIHTHHTDSAGRSSMDCCLNAGGKNETNE